MEQTKTLMTQISDHISSIVSFVWGPYFLIPLLVGTGIFITFRLKLIQVRGFIHAWQLISGKYDKSKDPGEITHFQALSTALAATIGTGNIVGVATAIALGGPGAVFWMWVTAVFGMSLKYSTCLLAVKYRKENDDGTISGGPMHFITIGLGKKWLGWMFAFFAMIASFGIGNMVQSNSVADALQNGFGANRAVTGIVIAILTGLVIIGGIKRIAKVAQRIVPFMTLVYISASVLILINYHSEIYNAFKLIFYYAFNPYAATGGFVGITITNAMRFGIGRGVFSNESGLGSAPMAHAAAKTAEPVREGLVAMLGPFIDTIVICTMTALVILVTGAWELPGETINERLSGAPLSVTAYSTALPGMIIYIKESAIFLDIGKYVVTFGLIFFAFSTILAWSYYGDRSTEFIFGSKSVIYYRIVYVMLIPVGAIMKLNLVWNISEFFNALMAIPNLIATILLSGVVARMTKEYFSKDQKPN